MLKERLYTMMHDHFPFNKLSADFWLDFLAYKREKSDTQKCLNKAQEEQLPDEHYWDL